MKRSFTILLLLLLLLSFPAAAQTRQRPEQARPPSTREAPAPEATAPAEERLSSTSQVVHVNGREIRYTATAGTLVLKDSKAKANSSMFFVAYIREGEDPRPRPITFCYNGGPGSASVWLHMGSFGPRRVEMAEDGFQPAPPFQLVENEFSLLDVTDLVYIDAISTGFSRATENPK